jgi:hypothetical protein
MFTRISVRLVVEGKEVVEGFPELSKDVQEALLYNVEHLLIFAM